MNKIHMDKRLNQLPTWLWTNSTTLPPVYKMVWEAVREDKVRSNGMQTELLVDTNKVFPLLLTSQLPTEVLGHIWNLANQKYAGQLTEQELYIVLALVAAAQTSYTFNSLDILHLLPFPPTPYLNIECLMNLQPVTQLNSASKFQNFNDNNDVSFISSESRYTSEVKGKTKLQHGIISSDVNLQMTNIVPGKVSSFDNKSHSSSTTMWDINNLFRDAKQAQRSHSDSKHSSAADPCDDFSEFQSAPIPSVSNIPNWDIKQGSAIGSRLANHNLGVKKPIEKSRKNNINAKSTHNSIQTRTSSTAINAMSHNKDQSTIDCLSELFPKCAIKNQSKTVILKDTVIRNNDPPKDYSDNITNHTNTISNTVHLINDKDVSNKLELTEKIAVSGTSDSAQQDLMNLQLIEDKYSALRALIEETTVPKLDPNASCTNHSVDEFGEFVSADQPATGTSTVNTLDTESFADIFTDFEFKSSCHNDGSITDISLMPEISESFDNLKLDDTVERSLEMGKTLQKEDAISINSIEFMNSASGALTRSGSVPSLDLKSFLPSNAEEDHVQDTTHQTVYWEWKQYMESCVLLLQVAANIFTNITSELVLYEVLNSAQGYNFLCNLAEVAAVCRRVNFSYKEMDINIIGFDDLLMDIDRIWAEMEPFYTNIPIVTELPAWPLHQGDSTSCSLCLTVITSGRVVYNDNNYHVTCANLWLNCVNSHLPAMRHPSFYSHTNVCPGNNHI